MFQVTVLLLCQGEEETFIGPTERTFASLQQPKKLYDAERYRIILVLKKYIIIKIRCYMLAVIVNNIIILIYYNNTFAIVY